ncbi:SDR family NAD(P)-dependent oxidoreductase [Thalassospira lucentensis]|uniref:SDR family NAD(P)-dependent oxidoreductase n=1 Tax=Thalassospira lucentensis TaxID=168935 RepID=UPI00142D6A5E|nr:SDR family NAD(P)-dependent oxidoreductase [Thalassospira lucentensis]NIZ03696.1 SDR family NAD(P)-dependent oxidoreductase [Thalassospira lucentensis]
MLLDGKIVFVTGATGGIGVPLVKLMRARGAHVIAYDRTSQGNLMENIDTTCKTLRENTPDILINLAGINDFNRAEHQNYDALVTLNLLVPMRLCQAVLPAMRARDHGQIVNIGSMVGLIPLPHVTGYAAAKSGLKGFSDALRRELHGTGVMVQHIAPRAVQTSMNSGKAGILNNRTGTTEDSPDNIARRIVDAIERDETDVRIGWPERFFAILHAVLPRMVDKGLRKNAIIGEEILAPKNANTVPRKVTMIAPNQNIGHDTGPQTSARSHNT